jgi:hypothetical protein
MVIPVAFAEAVAMAWAVGDAVGGHRVQPRIAQQRRDGALPRGVGGSDRTGIGEDTRTGGLGHGHTLEDIQPGTVHPYRLYIWPGYRTRPEKTTLQWGFLGALRGVLYSGA